MPRGFREYARKSMARASVTLLLALLLVAAWAGGAFDPIFGNDPPSVVCIPGTPQCQELLY